MFVRVKLIARRIRTAETFEAADPWNGGRLTPFRLEVYKMFPAHVTDPRDFRDGTIYTWGAKELYGIRSEIDGVERMLPTFLADAYSCKRLAAAQTPSLLARSESRLRSADFRPVASAGARTTAFAGAAVALAGAIGLSLVGGVRPKTSLKDVPVDAWLARPVVAGESYVISGMVPLAGKVPAPFGFFVPDAVARVSGRSFSVGWARTASGHRPLLLPEMRYERGGAVDVGFAVVLVPSEIGLSGSLEELRARVPDLDTSTITAAGWVGSTRPSPREMGRVASVLLLLAGLGAAVGGGAMWLAHAPQRHRNRILASQLLEACADAPR